MQMSAWSAAGKVFAPALISLPLHQGLRLTQVWPALAVFTLFMLACSIGKDRFVAWRRSRRQRLAAAAAG